MTTPNISGAATDGHCKVLLSLVTWMVVMFAIEASPPAAASWECLKMSGRPSSVWNIHAALKIRGGDWVLGRPRKAKRRTDRQLENIEDLSMAAEEPDVEGQEYYEYEYEYYEDDPAEEGNDDADEIYVEEENNDDADYDPYENNEIIVDDEKYVDRGIEDDVSQRNYDKFFRGWSKRRTKEDTGNNPDTNASNDERSMAQITGVAKRIPKGRGLIQVDYDSGDDEHRDNLFTTRIPAANQKVAQASDKFRPIKFSPSNTGKRGKKEENRKNRILKEVDDDDDDSNDHLYETPIPNVKAIKPQPSFMKAARSSKASSSSRWFKTMQIAKKTLSGRKPSRHKSSSNSSFISHPFNSGGSPRGVRSYNGKSHTSDWLYLLVAPIGNMIQSITRNAAAIISRWMSTALFLICNAFDFLWYGPVEGVTTTGIATREGGLSYFIPYAPAAIMSSVVILCLFRLLSRRWSELRSGDLLIEDIGVRSDDDEHEYDPSVEEELKFLHREFEAANPFSKKRIAVDLQSQSIKKTNQPLSKLRRGDGRPKSRRGQRQFTIKSIQTWWKERPSPQSIALIEPKYLRNQQQPFGQEVSRLQKKLAQSEQERAILREDLQHLQDKLQRVQNEARKNYSQHQRLEKEALMADQILSKAVQVERRKTNIEFGEVGESTKGALGRERMLMRGRIAGLERGNTTIQGQNDLDIRKAPSKRILDGVKIVREIDLDREDDDDRNWKGKAL